MRRASSAPLETLCHQSRFTILLYILRNFSESEQTERRSAFPTNEPCWIAGVGQVALDSGLPGLAKSR